MTPRVTDGIRLMVGAWFLAAITCTACGASGESATSPPPGPIRTTISTPRSNTASAACTGYVETQLDPNVQGKVAAAYETTVQAAISLRDRLYRQSAEEVGIVPPSLPTADELGLTPTASATLCYVDGRFSDPVPPGQPTGDRSIVLLTSDRAVVLGGGLSTSWKGLTPLGTPAP